jgi:hypothetical protein
MTATIISFPTMADRDDAEFGRTGQSSYIRAIDEAEALWDAAMGITTCQALASRVEAFMRQLELLEAQRPEVAGDTIALGGAMVELRLVPGLLAAMVGQRPA